MPSLHRDDLFILTNSEELVKDVFELFLNSNFLLRQGLAPTAYLVYYCVKELSRTFFKSLTPAAGRPRLPS